jgi:hypothetical protein
MGLAHRRHLVQRSVDQLDPAIAKDTGVDRLMVVVQRPVRRSRLLLDRCVFNGESHQSDRVRELAVPVSTIAGKRDPRNAFRVRPGCPITWFRKPRT